MEQKLCFDKLASSIFSHDLSNNFDEISRSYYKCRIPYNQIVLINFKESIDEFRDQLYLSKYQFDILKDKFLNERDIVNLELGELIYDIGL